MADNNYDVIIIGAGIIGAAIGYELNKRGRRTLNVEMLPAATRIDFAELSTLSELLASALVAPGEAAGSSHTTTGPWLVFTIAGCDA